MKKVLAAAIVDRRSNRTPWRLGSNGPLARQKCNSTRRVSLPLHSSHYSAKFILVNLAVPIAIRLLDHFS